MKKLSRFLSAGLLLALSISGCAWRSQPAEGANDTGTRTMIGLTQMNSQPMMALNSIETPAADVDRSGWPLIVAFGDSLTHGLGVPEAQNYPSQLQAMLDREGYMYRVVNKGVSGDTTEDGLNRLPQVLDLKPEVVILEFGANDGLRHYSITQMRANLAELIGQLQAHEIQVVLAGMQIPPAYGPAYTEAFDATFPELAAEFDLPLIPFMLEGVGGKPALNLPDGIHPTAAGYTYVVQNVFPVLEPLLQP